MTKNQRQWLLVFVSVIIFIGIVFAERFSSNVEKAAVGNTARAPDGLTLIPTSPINPPDENSKGGCFLR